MFGYALRLKKILAIIVIFLALTHCVIAIEQSTNTSVTITASTVFGIEFYTDDKIIYSTAIPFSDVDPSKSIAYPNGRAEDDGKSDTGVVCITNVGAPWYFNIKADYSEGLPEGSIKYYYSQPWNRNTGYQTNGTLTNNVEWRPLPKEASTIYTSGSDDTVNAPFGTLSTFSFAVNPGGLSSGEVYTVAITYTMTTAP